MVETYELWLGFKKDPKENLNKKFCYDNGKFVPIKFLEETKTEYFTFANLPAKNEMAKYLVEIYKGE